MVIRKRRKIRRMRRNRVVGYGRVSGGHRKGGQRGGVGAAGRKGHHKIRYIVQGISKDKGFVRLPLQDRQSRINVGILNEKAEQLGTKEGGKFNIDLNNLGIVKLLGTGQVTKKLHVTVSSASKTAVSKIENADGKVFLPSMEEE